MKMLAVTTEITLIPKRERDNLEIFDSGSVTIRLEDEGAGPFVSITALADKTLKFDIGEWPDVVAGVERIIMESKKLCSKN